MGPAVDDGHSLSFEVGTVEPDMESEATTATTGGGGLDLTVFGVGAKGELSRVQQLWLRRAAWASCVRVRVRLRVYWGC